MNPGVQTTFRLSLALAFGYITKMLKGLIGSLQRIALFLPLSHRLALLLGEFLGTLGQSAANIPNMPVFLVPFSEGLAASIQRFRKQLNHMKIIDHMLRFQTPPLEWLFSSLEPNHSRHTEQNQTQEPTHVQWLPRSFLLQRHTLLPFRHP